MTNIEKIKKIQAVLDSNTPRVEHYYRLLEDMEDIVYNYTDFVEQNVDNEFIKLEDADYHMCCCLMTLILKEDHFINGKFEDRFAEGKVTQILQKMVMLLKSI